MKKLLALVLALVMTLSLCVVSSNAKFDDAADITYTEAADVMQAVGVFVGDGTGNFYPKQNLTRAQAAKVIAYLDLGESVAEALPAVQMFSDVPATHWAAKYIAYCADAEIVAGVGNGKFDPEAQVTGYQFAKMLLVVLGYDVEIEKLTGMNWSISTAKLVKENKLSKGFKGSFNDGLTREGAAQIAFRAIQAQPVDTYTGYGLSLDNNGQLVTNSNGKAVKYFADGKKFDMNKDSLYADLYDGKLSTDDDNDELQNPATKWVYKNAKVGTYTDEPVLTYTTSWTWAQAKEDLAAAGVEIDTVANNVTVPVVVYENGNDGTTYLPTAPSDTPSALNMKAAIADNTKQGGNGVVTKFYANGDDYLNRVTEAKYQLAEVKTVVKDLASTKLVNEAALTLTLLGAENDYVAYTASDKNGALGFSSVYADAKVGDIFLVAVNETKAQKEADRDVKSIVAPVVKEGKLTSVGTNSVKFEGETYNKAKLAGVFNANATGNVKLYCDEFGYAYGTGDVDTNSKLVVVTDAYQSLEKGKLVGMIDVVYADGTTGSLKVKNYTQYTIGDIGAYSEDTTDNTYTLEKVNDYVNGKAPNDYYKYAKDTVKAGAVRLTPDLLFADNIKTIFVYFKDEADPTKGVKTVVAEGVKEIKAGAGIYFTVNTKGEVNALFVDQKPANTITGTDGIVFIYKNTTTSLYDSFDLEHNRIKVMDYAAYVDGKEIEEFHVVNGKDNLNCQFFELENDIDVENGYLLSTKFTKDDTIGVATGKVKSANIFDTKNAIAVGDVDVTVDNAKFVDVDSDDNYVVEDFSGLIENLNSADKNAAKGEASVSVIYNVKTMTALYVYVGAIVSK